MANLRVVYNNVAGKASLAASSTAGSLVVGNLLTDVKSEIWRSTGTSETLTLTWTASEWVGMVALPFCNFTTSATLRVRGYTEPADTTPVFDTGAKLACPDTFGGFGWGAADLGVNTFAQAGGVYAVSWFTAQPVKKLVIDVVDTGNPSGYVEAGRLVTGMYWTPMHNADYGVDLGMVDTSKHERSDAGDLKTDRGVMYKQVKLDLGMLPAVDRNAFWRLMGTVGLSKAMFFSLVPESDDASEEQMFMLYGKLSRLSGIKYQFVNQFSSSLELEEI